MEKSTGRKIKVLRSDNGGEYKSDPFLKLCHDNGEISTDDDLGFQGLFQDVGPGLVPDPILVGSELRRVEKTGLVDYGSVVEMSGPVRVGPASGRWGGLSKPKKKGEVPLLKRGFFKSGGLGEYTLLLCLNRI